MEESPRSRMTLRQALSRQWQIPLFGLSMAALAVVLLELRPRTVKPTFEEEFERLKNLSQQSRFQEFYVTTEGLRLAAEDEDQLGRIHALAAQTRIKELKQRHELSIEDHLQRSTPQNYQAIIDDYAEALHRNHPDPASPESVPVFYDLALAYWCLNDSDKAIKALEKAIEVGQEFSPPIHRLLVRMYLSARPEGYLDVSMEHLEMLLKEEQSQPDDKAWAFVRKSEVLIFQGKEEQSLALLNSADPTIQQSRYGDELNFLRGRALRQAGQTDQAELILRSLLEQLSDRGDIYAQTALELGKINYEQYRDQDAKHYYKLVVDSQTGKDWYAAGKLGLAECAAMQQHYDRAVLNYQEVVDLILQNPHNRSVTARQIQKSLAQWANKLSLFKQYDLALPFLELEQQVAPSDDISAAQRFAQMHIRRGKQLKKQLQQSQRDAAQQEPTETEADWLKQQSEMIKNHFEQAARQYLRIASLAVGDDELYGESLWQASVSYDNAGNTEAAIQSWHRFVSERQGENRWPRAMFNLAQAYQAIGQFEHAISYYETLHREHPKSIAAFDGMVPLARCYLRQEPPERERAEKLLRSLLEDRALTPRATYFRSALFELGLLYYDSQKYPEAINILTEAIDRYPDAQQLGKYMFLVADSYRKSGLALDKKLSQLALDPAATVLRQRTFDQRHSYLKNARDYFERAIEFYDSAPEARRNELDNMHMRHCWLYRADCLFDLGRFREAAELYELAALRYQLTSTALTAFVQIVNCHVKLGNINDARSANQRAIWQLRKMPENAFELTKTPLSRQQWQNRFEWTEKSNLW